MLSGTTTDPTSTSQIFPTSADRPLVMHAYACRLQKAMKVKRNAPCRAPPSPGLTRLIIGARFAACASRLSTVSCSNSFQLFRLLRCTRTGLLLMPHVTDIDHALSVQPASPVCSPRPPPSADAPFEDSTCEVLSGFRGLLSIADYFLTRPPPVCERRTGVSCTRNLVLE